MFKKKCLFGGGLGLGSSIIIAISASSVAVAEDNIGINQINTLLQVHWRIYAHNTIEETQSRLNNGWHLSYDTWFADEKYDESIKKVIGKAIADCVTNMNEFQDKKVGEIITFENTHPEDYDQANWNAVMLYNYVNKMVKLGTKRYGKDLKILTQEIMDNCYDELETKYFKDGSLNPKLLRQAKSDILSYINALDLSYNMCDYSKLFKEGEKIDAKSLASLFYFKGNQFSTFHFGGRIQQHSNRRFLKELYSLTFKYVNGGLYIEAIEKEEQKRRAGNNDIYYSGTLVQIKDKQIYDECNWIISLFEDLGIQVLSPPPEAEKYDKKK